MYYGYFGYFGLSIVVVGAVQRVVRWLFAFRNRGLVVKERPDSPAFRDPVDEIATD